MAKKNVQVLCSQQEYDWLEEVASGEGLTVSAYIRSLIFPDDSFHSCYKMLMEKVERLPSGTAFNIKALFGVEWTMDKGIKLSLGRVFFNRVDKGAITSVRATGKDSSNVMWYEKI